MRWCFVWLHLTSFMYFLHGKWHILAWQNDATYFVVAFNLLMTHDDWPWPRPMDGYQPPTAPSAQELGLVGTWEDDERWWEMMRDDERWWEYMYSLLYVCMWYWYGICMVFWKSSKLKRTSLRILMPVAKWSLPRAAATRMQRRQHQMKCPLTAILPSFWCWPWNDVIWLHIMLYRIAF